ncbi:MAG: HNH endonuclease, partial [Tissierellia bacterium]|nr:HNH endonuclease [Tissierellia bacterium]
KSTKKWNSKPEVREDVNKRVKQRQLEGKQTEWQRTESGKLSSQKAREKRKAKEHKISDKEWDDCKFYFNHRCAYCGMPIEEHFIFRRGKWRWIDFHKEHVIDQGRNDIKNTVPSCQTCNSSKHTSSLNSWYNKNNPNYTYERYHKIYTWLRYDYKKFIKKKKPKQKYTRKVSLHQMEISNKL